MPPLIIAACFSRRLSPPLDAAADIRCFAPSMPAAPRLMRRFTIFRRSMIVDSALSRFRYLSFSYADDADALRFSLFHEFSPL
jgi:hypothetical protein